MNIRNLLTSMILGLGLIACGVSSEVKNSNSPSTSPSCPGTSTPDWSFAHFTASSASRDSGAIGVTNLTGQTTSSQITLEAEASTYKDGNALPTTGDLNYRDIPDVNKDDDGHFGVNCKYAPRPSNDCGTTQSTLQARIDDCAIQNPNSSSWSGATQCNRGQGDWKLVTRKTANNEVWQDQRTKLLWSSRMSTGTNWCAASGNTQAAAVTYSTSYNNSAGTAMTGNGTIGAISGGSSSANETITITFTSATAFIVSGANCGAGSITAGGLTGAVGSFATWSRTNYCSFTVTQGSTAFAANDKFILQSVPAATYSCLPGAASGLQPASPISFCAEAAGLNPSSETWTSNGYSNAKGGLGKLSTPAVSWRLPNLDDFAIAIVNGIEMVMPDMGIAGTSRPLIDASPGWGNYEWTATSVAAARTHAWIVRMDGSIRSGTSARNITTNQVRCVGR